MVSRSSLFHDRLAVILFFIAEQYSIVYVHIFLICHIRTFLTSMLVQYLNEVITELGSCILLFHLLHSAGFQSVFVCLFVCFGFMGTAWLLWHRHRNLTHAKQKGGKGARDLSLGSAFFLLKENIPIILHANFTFISLAKTQSHGHPWLQGKLGKVTGFFNLYSGKYA